MRRGPAALGNGLIKSQSSFVLSVVAGLALLLVPLSQAHAQLARSISGHDLKLPKSLPDAERKKLLGEFDKRCTKGPAHAKVCCFTIAVDACKDPVLGVGCDTKKLVGYGSCVEEACEFSCPIPEASDTFQRYQAEAN